MPRAVQLALRLPRARTQEPPWGRWAVDSGVVHCGIHSERECVFFVSKGRKYPLEVRIAEFWRGQLPLSLEASFQRRGEKDAYKTKVDLLAATPAGG